MSDFKNRKAQLAFKALTSNTDEFSNCFKNNQNLKNKQPTGEKYWTAIFTKVLRK